MQALKQQEILQDQEKNKISDEFVKDHMSIVEAIASNIVAGGKVPPGIDFGDLVSWGIEGLIKAKKNFKPEKGAQFKSYAFYRVRGEILDCIRREWQYRNPSEYTSYRKKLQEKIAELAENQLDEAEKSNANDVNWTGFLENTSMAYLITLDEIDVVSEKEGTKNPEIEHVHENRSMLLEEIDKLEADEKNIIELFYHEGLKQVDISERLNYSKSKVCRIHMQALEKLRRRLEKRYNE